jgi:SHS2 domain-containing protein
MGGFELADHTADLRIVATGDGFGDALAWVATGMFSVVVDLETVRARESVEVHVESTSREVLVVDWLNELLYRFEGEGFLPKAFQVSVDESGTALNAVCEGEPIDPARHQTWPGLKAATYHALEVSHNGEWRVQVVLDI